MTLPLKIKVEGVWGVWQRCGVIRLAESFQVCRRAAIPGTNFESQRRRTSELQSRNRSEVTRIRLLIDPAKLLPITRGTGFNFTEGKLDKRARTVPKTERSHMRIGEHHLCLPPLSYDCAHIWSEPSNGWVWCLWCGRRQQVLPYIAPPSSHRS